MPKPKQNNITELTVSNRTVVRVILLILATLAGIKIVFAVSNVLVLIFISVFLALALNPAVSWISHKLKLKSRATATGMAYILVIAIIAGFLTYILPPLVSQTVDYVQDSPQTIESLKTGDTTLSHIVQKYGLQDQLDGFKVNVQDRTKSISKPVVANAGRVGSALVSIITVLALTFMMIVEGPSWLKRYLDMLPSKTKQHHQQLADKMYQVIIGYVNGQLLLATLAASFSFVVLVVASTALGVSVNAIALAGILVITGLIPMIGNIIGGVIVTLACLFVSTPLAIIVAVFFVLYQQIENVSLQPYIQAKYNALSPLLVLVSAMIGVGLWGFLGALVAIPVAGCLKILLIDYLQRRS